MAKGKATANRRIKKGLLNRRYLQTERAIIEVLVKAKEMPTTAELTRRARISRSTLYRHHRAIPGIIPDYEKELLFRYKRIIRRLLKRKSSNLKSICFQSLLFILNYKHIFKILFKYSGDRVVEEMVLINQNRIIKVCYLPKNSSRILRIYAKEVAGIIELWGEKNFPDDEISAVLNDIMKLTTGIKNRLGDLR